MSVMDDDKPVTRKDLTQFSDAILNGVEGMITKVRGDIGQVKDELKTEIKENRRQINDLNIDTPTRKEFDNLKERVETFHPSN